jgi:hypothetical protein
LYCTTVLALQVLLYETIALLIAAGLWATVSLLLRHWDSIEAHASKTELTEPLLQQQQQQREEGSGVGGGGGIGTPPPPSAAAAAEAGGFPGTPGTPKQQPEEQQESLTATVWRQRSLPPLAAYNSLEPYQTFLSSELVLEWPAAACSLCVGSR